MPEFREACDIELFMILTVFRIARSFAMKGQDGGKDVAMVPLVDLTNHGVAPNAKWGFDARSNSFQLWAVREIKEGEAVAYVAYSKVCDYIK